jgi:flagellin-specific chaperone FliS
MLREIVESSRKDDCELLQPVQELLETLYEGWKDAVEQYKKERAGAGQSGMQKASVG